MTEEGSMTNVPPAGNLPPWVAYAAKAMTALAVCLAAALGVLLSAVSDGWPPSAAEWVAIAFAFFNAVATPTGVYLVQNNYAGRRVSAPGDTLGP
jgi:hypothetical protein